MRRTVARDTHPKPHTVNSRDLARSRSAGAHRADLREEPESDDDGGRPYAATANRATPARTKLPPVARMLGRYSLAHPRFPGRAAAVCATGHAAVDAAAGLHSFRVRQRLSDLPDATAPYRHIGLCADLRERVVPLTRATTLEPRFLARFQIHRAPPLERVQSRLHPARPSWWHIVRHLVRRHELVAAQLGGGKA